MVIGNSEAVVRELRAEHVSEAKLHLIYNGIDVSAQRPKRARGTESPRIRARRAIVGVMVSNLIHYKGHHDLITASSMSRNTSVEWTFCRWTR